MNREIIFRGKRVGNGEWVYGNLLLNTIDHEDKAYIIPYFKSSNNFDYIEIIPESVGQYTGLRDQNNRAIYEWDIIHIWYSRDTSGTDIVEWNEVVQFECYGDKSGFEIPFLNRCEVVGNIYEHSHICSQQKKNK